MMFFYIHGADCKPVNSLIVSMVVATDIGNRYLLVATRLASIPLTVDP